MPAPQAESLLRRLGFAPDARVAVVHADDIGMCHAANEGALEALRQGPATCGSLMVPCPWFAEAAARARAQPELDLGVHLTLNAEWEHYRWGPVAGRGAVPSLVDEDGGFFRTSQETARHGKPEEVEIELRAQIERALAAGIDVTHLDAHMGTVFLPPFLSIYTRLARDHRVPAFVVRPRVEDLADRSMSAAIATIHEEVDALESEGFPVLDAFDSNSLGFPAGAGLAHNRDRLRGLRPGVTYLVCHPARGGEELAAITEDAHCRDFERTFYGGPEGRRAFEEEGIATIGMRALRELLRQAS